MNWIVKPKPPGPLGCTIDLCGPFCLVQYCPGDVCYPHYCGIYVHDAES